MLDRVAVGSAEAMAALGARLAASLKVGNVVLLEGELGAGKTTLVRGLVAALSGPSIVRSPSFNLIQLFETEPPILHADLYRLSSGGDLGLEDYFDSHVCLIEWPDRMPELSQCPDLIRIRIEFDGDGRFVTIERNR